MGVSGEPAPQWLLLKGQVPPPQAGAGCGWPAQQLPGLLLAELC